MATRLYLQPIGLVSGATAAEAVSQQRAGALAGGATAFTGMKVIEGEPGRTRAEIRTFEEICASRDGAIAAGLQRISATRAELCGFGLDRPLVMGVVNVTPDSFSDGGLYDNTEAAVAHAAKLKSEGADILDIGGESTRPGSDVVEAAQESERIIPVIEGLKGAGAVISADTRKAAVMRKASDAGAHIINDVSALTHDPESLKTAADTGLPVVLMHAQGDPRTMQDDPAYEDVLLEVYDYLEARVAACEKAGIARERLVADPGIGFGKTLEHNLALLDGLALLHGLGVPLLLGASRKRFIGTLTDVPEPRERVPGSLAAALAGVARGVQVVRVHDVAATRQALTVWRAINP